MPGDDGESALSIVIQYLDCSISLPSCIVLYFRLISKSISELWPPSLIRKWIRTFKSAQRYRTITVCISCMKHGRFSNHYRFCSACRPVFAPEMTTSQITKQLYLPAQLIQCLTHRQSPGLNSAVLYSIPMVWEVLERYVKTHLSKLTRKLKRREMTTIEFYKKGFQHFVRKFSRTIIKK